jgi:TolA-binding protein
MATFYVMEHNQKHTYFEVLDGLLSHQAYFLDYIKTNHFEDVEMEGLKLFLENNNYDIQLLKNFIEPPLQNLQTKKQTPFGNYYKIAAGIVLVISLGFLVKLSVRNKTSAITNYWIEDAGFKVWMGDSDKSMALNSGMSYYRAEDYKLALEQFVKITQNDTALYYSGISFIKLNELDSAEKVLKQLLPESAYKNKSNFYLSLCYLSNNKTSEGLKILDNITFTENDFEIKRQSILSDLKTNPQ